MRPGPLLVPLALLAGLPARGADAPCKPVNPCEVPEGTAAAVPEPAAELTAEVKQLFRLVACRGAPPAGLDPAAVKAYCGKKAKREERARTIRAAVDASLPDARPEKVPSVVVSPLSGGDLLAARSAFPAARNYTLTGPMPAGAAVPDALRAAANLAPFLEDASMTGTPRAALPALLGALAAEGAEPVGLRYFRVEPRGSLRFYSAPELRAQGEGVWRNCELLFVSRGEPGRQLVVRYLQADLTDAGAAAEPGPLAHLASKGSFAALLPAEGAVAGPEYGRLRGLLEQRAPVVVARKR